jgi:hypothetical protein
MTPTLRRARAAAALVVCLVTVAGCVNATPSPTPTATASQNPTATGSPSTAPSASPNATPAVAPTASPTVVPSASPSTAADCKVQPQEGPLSSDRMTNVVISSTDEADVMTFVFGNASLPGPAGQPRGDLRIAKPPYTQSGSGQKIKMVGDHVLMLRFTHMSLSSDTGDLVYNGPDEFKPDLSVLRHAVQFDAFEGQIGWYIGYDGAGCVTLGRDGNNVTIAFARS